jgi:hypothetical protein
MQYVRIGPEGANELGDLPATDNTVERKALVLVDDSHRGIGLAHVEGRAEEYGGPIQLRMEL